MKRSFVFLSVVSVLVGMLTTTPAFAASKKKPTPAPVHTPVISSVSATSITVAEEKTARTFTVSPFTEIYVNGQKASVADLKPGMAVTIALGTDPSRASRINAPGK